MNPKLLMKPPRYFAWESTPATPNNSLVDS
jgi:hypothetical protein